MPSAASRGSWIRLGGWAAIAIALAAAPVSAQEETPGEVPPGEGPADVGPATTTPEPSGEGEAPPELDTEPPDPPAAVPDPTDLDFEDPTAPPAAGLAPDPPTGPLETTWTLDDGVGEDEVPWDDFDFLSDYAPAGPIHLGVQLRVAALPWGNAPALDGPMVELGFIGDLRYHPAAPWHLRLVLAFAYQPHQEAWLGAGSLRVSSPFAAKLRALLVSVDIGNYFSFRAGPDVGVQLLLRPDQGQEAEIFGGATAEFVLRLAESRLEIGLVAGLQFIGVAEINRSGYSQYVTPEAVFGGSLGYLLL